MMRLARTALAAAALTALAGSGAPQPANSLTFYQLDIDFDGDKRQKSQWGYAELEFVGSAETLYFNLAVEGFWRLRNVPVLSPEGPGEPHTASFGFDLGVPPGTKVKFLSYGGGADRIRPLRDAAIAPGRPGPVQALPALHRIRR